MHCAGFPQSYAQWGPVGSRRSNLPTPKHVVAVVIPPVSAHIARVRSAVLLISASKPTNQPTESDTLMNRYAVAALATRAALGISLALGFTLSSHAIARAEESLPVCQLEDGSDSASLPCLWVDPDTENGYLTYPDHSVLVVDDTAR